MHTSTKSSTKNTAPFKIHDCKTIEFFDDCVIMPPMGANPDDIRMVGGGTGMQMPLAEVFGKIGNSYSKLTVVRIGEALYGESQMLLNATLSMLEEDDGKFAENVFELSAVYH